jgi:hypothetical protein
MGVSRGSHRGVKQEHDMNSTETVDNLGIPPLAGVCTYERAALPGLGVERTTAFLKRCNYVLRRLHETAAAHLAATPEWEVKCALGLHLWLDAEHCGGLRARVAEMREPPLHLDDAPDEPLRAALEELLRAGDTAELVTGVYGVVRPALVHAVRAHLAAMNPLFDHPTYRLLRGIEREQDEIIAWGEAARTALTADRAAAARAAAFADHLERYLAAAGGIGGGEAADGAELPAARWDGGDYAMDPEPRRDGRFVDRFNCSAKIDDIYADESRPADERAYALVHKRLREMDVPEWMAPILFSTRGRPWDYYRELGRQLWDETRHAMMGEVALHAAGVPFYDYPIDMAASASLNCEFTPLEAHILLWDIEQGLMPRETGKRWEWTIAGLDGDPLLVALQDYDWADEVLHAQIGRRWLAGEHGTAAERKAVAKALWERWNPALERYSRASAQDEWWEDFIARARAGRTPVA